MHGCSLGEVKSFEPLLRDCTKSVSIFTTTQTGYEQAQKICDEVRYLPFEIFLPFWLRKTKLLVVTEAELWYMLFFVCKNLGAKTMLINARISDKSYKNYKKFSFFYKRIFENIDMVFAQTNTDKQRLQEFGAKNVIVNGNIKTALVQKVTKKYDKKHKRLIVLASTHENEEELILKDLKLQENDMLVVVPRHPQRFLHVKQLANKYAKKNTLKCKFFSEVGFEICDILVCDTLGELINIYAISDISILCGSFVNGVGGHNPLECAYFNNVIISGEYIFNQKALYSHVENIYFCKSYEINDMLKKNLLRSKLHIKDALKDIKKEFRNIK